MKLEDITKQIYAEGVEKGKAQADEIIKKANEEAAAIIAKAQKTADEKIAKAEAKAQELDTNTRAELKLFAGQALNALKTEVTDLINGAVVAENIKAAAADKKFMQDIILKMAESMAKEGGVVIEAKDAKALTEYFAKNAKALLDKGVKIEEVKGIKTDFQIVAAKGGYKLAFGEKEFEAYFKEFLRPQLIELLF